MRRRDVLAALMAGIGLPLVIRNDEQNVELLSGGRGKRQVE
jgi:hypothetical protein